MHGEHVKVRVQLLRVGPFLYHVGLRNQTQVARLISRCIYLLSHLSGPTYDSHDKIPACKYGLDTIGPESCLHLLHLSFPAGPSCLYPPPHCDLSLNVNALLSCLLRPVFSMPGQLLLQGSALMVLLWDTFANLLPLN